MTLTRLGVAAAVVAGAFSLADGARMVALRSRAISEIAGKGGMLSLAAERAQVRVTLVANHPMRIPPSPWIPRRRRPWSDWV